jgi:hypothetical protein
MPNLDWLDDTHEVFDANVERWEQNERRLRGGDYVIDELRPFLWESLPGGAADPNNPIVMPGTHYLARQSAATYLNFPEMYTTTMVGHLARGRPLPGTGLSFGGLGEVRRERDFALPSPAEQVYYNADGVGNDGSQWDNFWFGAWQRAAATGHRWIFVEAPSSRPQSRLEEIQGLRPYLTEFSPQQVTNWHFEQGRLAFIVVRIAVRNPVVDSDGALQGNVPVPGYLLMVRSGFTNLGDEFAAGGWWVFNSDKQLVSAGDWRATRGDIPIWPLFYERDTGVVSSDEAVYVSIPAMSRPGTTELGQAAIAYMNLSSAADYDAWDAASSLRFLLGVDRQGFEIARGAWDAGSQIVPVPANDNGQIPQVNDGSGGAVVAGVFDVILKRKLQEVERLAMQEATGSPDASGVAKQVGFVDLKAPRLANVASEIEQSQNVAIYFLELRWGKTPSGSVVWPREFDVVNIADDIMDVFNAEKVSGYKSPTLGARLMVRMAQEKGFIVDDADAQKIESEYENSAKMAAAASAAGVVTAVAGADAATSSADKANADATNADVKAAGGTPAGTPPAKNGAGAGVAQQKAGA